jgi:hypothetical protein
VSIFYTVTKKETFKWRTDVASLLQQLALFMTEQLAIYSTVSNVRKKLKMAKNSFATHKVSKPPLLLPPACH